MRRGFKTWAENQSLRARHICGVLPHAALAARTLAARLDVEVLAVDEIPDLPDDVLTQLTDRFGSNWSAVTLPLEDAYMIVFNPGHVSSRQESDIMHELAHIVCGHKADPVKARDIPFVLRTYNDEQEKEAEWLGACLQIPRAGLLSMARRGYNNEVIATFFGASEEMVAFRRNTTGIDQQLVRGRRWKAVSASVQRSAASPP